MSQLRANASEFKSSNHKSETSDETERYEQWRKDGELWTRSTAAINAMLGKLTFENITRICQQMFQLLRFLGRHSPRHGFSLFLAGTLDKKADDSVIKGFVKNTLYDRNLLGEIRGLLFTQKTQVFKEQEAEPTDRIIGLFVEKSMACGYYSTIYAKAFQCLLQLCTDNGAEELDLKRMLRRSLLNQTEKAFQDGVLGVLNCKERGDPALSKQALSRALNIVTWVGELFKSSLIDDRIAVWCVNALSHPLHCRQSSSEDSKTTEQKADRYDARDLECLEALVKLVSVIGHRLESLNPRMIETIMADIVFMAEDVPVARLRFMALDLLDLQKRSWQLRHQTWQPKTLSEVRAEYRQELRQKEEQGQGYRRARRPTGRGRRRVA